MTSYSTATAANGESDPKSSKRKASTATIDESGEYSERSISPDSRRRRVEPQTTSSSNNRLLARLGGSFEARKQTILDNIANIPTPAERLAALQRDVTTITNIDEETTLENDLDVAKFQQSTLTDAKASFETHHEDMLIDPAMVKTIRDSHTVDEIKCLQNINTLQVRLMIVKQERLRLERERKAAVERLYQENVEYWETLEKVTSLGPDGMSTLGGILSQNRGPDGMWALLHVLPQHHDEFARAIDDTITIAGAVREDAPSGEEDTRGKGKGNRGRGRGRGRGREGGTRG